ncbi:MAG TPA: hypothetical protein VMA86_07100 [Acetobacteraceae bacterium]|nr:hypothetical protein [Acetobacteraceae bacterium]
MVDPIDINRRNWDERAGIHARDTTGDYMLARFRAGEDALHAIEAAELGDISGKRVLHLQCHIGRDTLCLVRRGVPSLVPAPGRMWRLPEGHPRIPLSFSLRARNSVLS